MINTKKGIFAKLSKGKRLSDMDSEDIDQLVSEFMAASDAEKETIIRAIFNEVARAEKNSDKMIRVMKQMNDNMSKMEDKISILKRKHSR